MVFQRDSVLGKTSSTTECLGRHCAAFRRLRWFLETNFSTSQPTLEMFSTKKSTLINNTKLLCTVKSINFWENTFKCWNRIELFLENELDVNVYYRSSAMNYVLISELNMRKKSNSRGWILPTITKEWRGWPNSQAIISFSVQTLIFWSGQPTRATPTHRVSPVSSA